MKTFICVMMALVFVVSSAFAGSTLVRDGEGQKILAPAWDATLSQAITSTASQNIAISGRIFYEFTPTADCKARLMNTTTKSSWPQFQLKANTPFRASNDANTTKARAAFLNVSGCTGDFRAQ